MSPGDIQELYRRLAEADPAPTTELEWASPYTLLIAVVLSAQSTDVGVNKATRTLFRDADTPEKMVALGEDAVRAHIRTVNFANTKARNLIALSQRLIAEHGGQVPADRAALEALPGVGGKTASVILNTAFGHETIAVDTHIFRVANRTGLAPGKDVAEVQAALERITPPPYRLHAHHWLLLHGRYICKARVPECWRCPIIDLCRYEPKTPAPRAKAAAAATRR